MPWLVALFDGQYAKVDRFYEDLSPEKLTELEEDARGATRILFDFYDVSPFAGDGEGRSASQQKIQQDTIEFGTYVVYSSIRDDDGYQRRLNAYRAIYKIRAMMSRKHLELTCDPNGDTKKTQIRFTGIERVRDIPGLAIYRINYACDATIGF